MPEGAECCAVKGVIVNRDNRLDMAVRSLSSCLATLERTRSPRAQQAFETLLDTYRRRGAFAKEYALIGRWLNAYAEQMDPDAVADPKPLLATCWGDPRLKTRRSDLSAGLETAR
jgi:hypothetical protein